MDVLGKTVKTIAPTIFHEGDNFFEINMNDLKKGIYLLRLISSNGSVIKKLSKVE